MDIQVRRQHRYQDRVRAAGIVDQLIARQPGGRIDDHVIDVSRNCNRAGTAFRRRQGMDFRQVIRAIAEPMGARTLAVHVQEADVAARGSQVARQTKGEGRLPRSAFRIEYDDLVQSFIPRQFEQRPTPSTPGTL